MNDEPKNCLNCGHRAGTVCVPAGMAWMHARQFNRATCDVKMSGWVPMSKVQRKHMDKSIALGLADSTGAGGVS